LNYPIKEPMLGLGRFPSLSQPCISLEVHVHFAQTVAHGNMSNTSFALLESTSMCFVARAYQKSAFFFRMIRFSVGLGIKSSAKRV
jgi:hypothetical protein